MAAGTTTSNTIATLSDEETNFLRAAFLIIHVCPKAVRTLFDKHHPPAVLTSQLAAQQSTLKKCKGIFKSNWSSLFPSSGPAKSSEFGITLLMTLLRNFTLITQPSTGWDAMPLIYDISDGADLVRIRLYRNQIFHSNEAVLTDNDFKVLWTDLKYAIDRLSGGTMTKELDDSERVVLDQTQRKLLLHNIQTVKDLMSHDQEIKEIKQKYGEKFKEMEQKREEKIRVLKQDLNQAKEYLTEEQNQPVPRNIRGQPGRPRKDIKREQLQCFQQMGYTVPKMAEHFNCSSQLVYKRLYEEGLPQRNKFSAISNEELDATVTELHEMYPSAGSVMMSGFLESRDIRVQRKRVRESLVRIDPTSSSMRYAEATKRRKYSVATPNFLWHIDGHMKLIRWGITTHAGIDGYSRLITYLACGTNNQASTVLHHFVQACVRYGIPAKVRCDHGGENILVGLFINLVNGARDGQVTDCNSIITGSSVHNQRIERLWRDVFDQVICFFYQLFYEMEDEGLLDINNNVHLICIQLIFIPVINNQLKAFTLAWNKHKIRTEQHRSPEKLWLDGVLSNLNSTSLAISNLFNDNSVEMTLEESLQHYGLTVNHFEEHLQHEPLNVLQLNNEQMRDFTIAIAEMHEPKQKFARGLSVLQNIVNIN